jgi:hypothetical protein
LLVLQLKMKQIAACLPTSLLLLVPEFWKECVVLLSKQNYQWKVLQWVS